MAIPDQFVAALGLKRLLQENFKVLKSDIVASLKNQDKLLKAAENIIQDKPVSDSVKSDLTTKDIPELKAKVVELQPETLMPVLIKILEGEGVGIEIGMQIMTIINTLKNVLPPESIKTTELTSLDYKFLWAAKIADNPLHILELFSTQQLTDFDVKNIQVMYPDIYQDMVNAIITASIKEFSDTGHIPRRIKLSLSILLQVPVLDVTTLQAYQDNDDKKDAKIAPSPEPSQSSADLNIAHTESEKI